MLLKMYLIEIISLDDAVKNSQLSEDKFLMLTKTEDQNYDSVCSERA